MEMQAFTRALLDWYAQGHRDLPWRHTRDAYSIWISEIMLQQTRAETVVSYYERFLAAFPDVASLAAADEQEVLKRWEGLGYYSRARNLQAAARVVCEQYGGELPRTAQALQTLPGIGAYTAGAIASIAYGESVAAVDGNVQRVIARWSGVREDITQTQVKRELSRRCQALVPPQGGEAAGAFSNAMMELGATVCTPANPACLICPVRAGCSALAEGDAAQLPVKKKARAQRVEKRAVVIVLSGGRVLVKRRTEKLLGGMWVFPDFEDVSGAAALSRALEESLGLSAAYDEALGAARHVFTHIIWEMELHAFYAPDQKEVEGAMWVDAQALSDLPMPTAVRAARRAAMKKLRA
jgi:A/G-specific adenine glycosylase